MLLQGGQVFNPVGEIPNTYLGLDRERLAGEISAVFEILKKSYLQF